MHQSQTLQLELTKPYLIEESQIRSLTFTYILLNKYNILKQQIPIRYHRYYLTQIFLIVLLDKILSDTILNLNSSYPIFNNVSLTVIKPV